MAKATEPLLGWGVLNWIHRRRWNSLPPFIVLKTQTSRLQKEKEGVRHPQGMGVPNQNWELFCAGLKKRFADHSFENSYKAIRNLNETSKNTQKKKSRPRRCSETMEIRSVDLHHNCGFFATRDPHVGTIVTTEQAQASKLRCVKFRLRRPIRISRVLETHEIGTDAPVAHCASRASSLGLQHGGSVMLSGEIHLSQFLLLFGRTLTCSAYAWHQTGPFQMLISCSTRFFGEDVACMPCIRRLASFWPSWRGSGAR